MPSHQSPPSFPTPPRLHGFSIVELLVALAILALLATLAGPGFVSALNRYKIGAMRDELIASMQLAKAEALRRGIPVYLLRTTGCGNPINSADDWSCGWEVFVDSNDNGNKNAGEPVLQVVTVPHGFAIVHTGLGSKLKFDLWGMTGVGHAFVLAPPEGPSSATAATLCINRGERIRQVEGAAKCS